MALEQLEVLEPIWALLVRREHQERLEVLVLLGFLVALDCLDPLVLLERRVVLDLAYREQLVVSALVVQREVLAWWARRVRQELLAVETL